MSSITFKKTVIIGVGLIGGSLALCMKKKGFVDQVVGFGRSRGNLEDALRVNIIDKIGSSFAEEIPGADLVVLAVPVGQMGKTMAEIEPYLNDHCLIIDVGSTKMNIIEEARTFLKEKTRHFVPTHPIAGTEKNGALAAFAALFVDHQIILTPLPENTIADIDKIRFLWASCGAIVLTMSADHHDRFFAAVSHLPHLLSYALVYDINRRPNGDEFFSFAAGGFRDFTRIAASSPDMWRDVCLANRDALLDELAIYQAVLSELK